jgi:hypothetical protein
MATDPKDREYLKTEDPTLLKDTYTGALISSDISKLKQHKIRQRQFERSKVAENEINSMKEEIYDLKGNINQIKNLLQKLIDKEE